MKKLKEILFLKNIKGVGKAAIYAKFWNALQVSTNIDGLMKMVAKESSFSDDLIQEARSKAEKIYAEISDDLDIHIVTIFDEEYPDKLHIMGNKKPLILYIKGNMDVLKMENISVIGTRKPSEWSVVVEKRLVKKILALSNRVIVSGLALGCDKIAHETTVNEKRITAAIMPCGVNVIAPVKHKKLAEDILVTGGCLISEYEPNVKAFKQNFIERDAIVAAFSDITLVVECNEKSGAMHTVKYAYEYKRPIGCYYPDDIGKGSYGGNEYMVNNLNAFRILGTEELKKLLSIRADFSAYSSERKEPVQLLLSDFISEVDEDYGV